jgi:hypothetical protein
LYTSVLKYAGIIFEKDVFAHNFQLVDSRGADISELDGEIAWSKPSLPIYIHHG